MLQIDNAENAVQWPHWLPAEYVDALGARPTLGNRVAEFLVAYESLTPPDRKIAHDALLAHNRLPDNLQGLVHCVPKSDLPLAIRQSVSELFEYAFKLLTELGCRDEQYKILYSASPWKVCPFCGMHLLDGVGAPREDLDHYLPRSKYPFCGANLYNLAPMCSRCNRSYKRTKDVIYDDQLMSQSRASDPFSGPVFRICLNNTPPYDGTTLSPNWHVEIMDQCEEAYTWNRVFSIKERYLRDLLSPHFTSWIRDFGRWGAQCLRRLPTPDELLDIIRDYIGSESLKGISDAAFLKVSVFCMFLVQLENDNNALRDWLGDQIRIYL